MIGRLIDNLAGVVSPQWGLKRSAARQAIAQLGTYAAADRGRGNNDWRSNSGSADLAIIADSRILNARARQMIRDSWIASSAIKAASRNVVGKGIIPVAMAHDGNGKPLDKVNARLQREFWKWASNARFCDVEKKQNFWQKQALLVEERYGVGNAFLCWSYQIPASKSEPVGLRFQSFEVEMLDTTKQWYGTNEVRNGVELDDQGAPAAYHFWTRNPADYLYRRQMHSVRIPASRVFHYYKQDRVLQTLGVTPLAPVMQSIRDFDRYQQASLWSAIMQACIGMVITKEFPTGAGMGPFGMQNQANDTGSTAGGMRKVDFVPGMAPELMPGEDVKFLNPNQPGNQYEPFTAVTLRGIGAGMGISYGLLARHFDGNFSAARQDMLEDNKQWEPEQDLLIDSVLDRIYALWVERYIMEGRLDDIPDEFRFADFLDDQSRFTEADHVTPAKPWIDPQKEMNAAERALALNLKTHEQIITELGGRYRDVFTRKAAEAKFARSLGIELDDDKLSAFRRDMLKTLAADRAVGATVANLMDVTQAMADVGLPIRSGQQQADVPIADPNAKAVAAKPAPKPAAMSAGIRVSIPETASAAVVPGQPVRPPGYKLEVLPETRCGTCSNLDASSNPDSTQRICRKFSFPVDEKHVCDAWEAPPIDANTNVNRGRTLPPSAPPGERPLDRNFDNPARQDGTQSP